MKKKKKIIPLAAEATRDSKRAKILSRPTEIIIIETNSFRCVDLVNND